MIRLHDQPGGEQAWIYDRLYDEEHGAVVTAMVSVGLSLDTRRFPADNFIVQGEIIPTISLQHTLLEISFLLGLLFLYFLLFIETKTRNKTAILVHNANLIKTRL